MTRYSLFVVKVPLNPQANKQTNLAIHSYCTHMNLTENVVIELLQLTFVLVAAYLFRMIRCKVAGWLLVVVITT